MDASRHTLTTALTYASATLRNAPSVTAVEVAQNQQILPTVIHFEYKVQRRQ